MATENVGFIHTDKLAQGVPLTRVGEGLGENVSGLVVGPDVADVNPLGKHRLQKANAG